MVQESRLRLLQDDGRGLTLVLSPAAAVEPQDLPPLTHRRVRVAWRTVPGMTGGTAHRIELLD